MEATHDVTRDVFDPSTGEKRLSAGQQVKAVDLGDQFYVWQVPYDHLARPVTMTPWLVSSSLRPIRSNGAAKPNGSNGSNGTHGAHGSNGTSRPHGPNGSAD